MQTSSLTFDLHVFKPAAIDESTKRLNAYLVDRAGEGMKWHEIGAAEYRRLQDEGKTGWPAPPKLEHAKDIYIPSRDPGRDIKCRLIEPQNGTSRGIFLHMHGGGHVLGHADWQDAYLTDIANSTSLTCISIEYRLAPENPFPASTHDSIDVATHLVDHALTMFSIPLQYIGGESAGASLSLKVILHLLTSRPEFSFSGAVLCYGLYDWSLLPCAAKWTNPLITTTESLSQFRKAYLPGKSHEELKHPDISPIYHEVFAYDGMLKGRDENREKKKLPKVLFLTGTRDAVLDDQVLMSFKWGVAGGEAIVRFVEGAPHALLMLDEKMFVCAKKGKQEVVDFLNAKA